MIFWQRHLFILLKNITIDNDFLYSYYKKINLIVKVGKDNKKFIFKYKNKIIKDIIMLNYCFLFFNFKSLQIKYYISINNSTKNKYSTQSILLLKYYEFETKCYKKLKKFWNLIIKEVSLSIYKDNKNINVFKSDIFNKKIIDFLLLNYKKKKKIIIHYLLFTITYKYIFKKIKHIKKKIKKKIKIIDNCR